MAIREIAADDRPRERAARSGVAALADRELLALVLGSGNRREDALELATRLMARRGFRWLATASVRELAEEPGLGLAQATRIAAGFELSRRFREGAAGRRLATAASLAAAVRPLLAREREEVLLLVLLDARLGLLRTLEVARGGVAGATFAPRDVLAPALREGAARIALAHNHPSGDPSPSPEDARSTLALAAAASIVGIELVDHVIVGRRRWVSLRRRGLLRA